MPASDAASASLIDAARQIAPQIRAYREQAEQERRLPDPLVRLLVDAGLFRMFVPRTLVDERELTPRERAHLRLAITHGITTAVQVVDAVFTAGGASALFSTNPLDQHFRDIHAAAAHIQATPRHYQTTGQVFLGLGPPPGVSW